MMRQVWPVTYGRLGHKWIALNRYLHLTGIGHTRKEARADLVASGVKLRTELRENRETLGPWPQRCLRYFERKTLR